MMILGVIKTRLIVTIRDRYNSKRVTVKYKERGNSLMPLVYIELIVI